VLERLAALHDKSLLVVDRDGNAPVRYRTLETVRQFAQERLNDAGDSDATRTRHLLHYVALVEEAALGFRGPQQGAWMARLRLEQENLLAAHAWCAHAPGGAELGLQLVGGLWHYWSTSAQLERGCQLAQTALEQAGDGSDSPARCRALFAIGQLALFMGRYDETLTYGEQSLAMARRIEHAEQITMGLGLVATGLHSVGNTSEALLLYEEASELARKIGNSYWLSSLLNGLAEVHRGTGNLSVAERYYEESISCSRQRGDARRTAVSLGNLARLLIVAGELERARATLIESRALAETAGLKGLGEHLLEISAGLASALGDPGTAARLHGAALARMHDDGTRREPVDEAFVAPLMARSREALGATAFDCAEAAGQLLSFEASMAEVNQWLDLDA
jgi:tetratricopeptide (TPR) repeat protein